MSSWSWEWLVGLQWLASYRLRARHAVFLGRACFFLLNFFGILFHDSYSIDTHEKHMLP